MKKKNPIKVGWTHAGDSGEGPILSDTLSTLWKCQGKIKYVFRWSYSPWLAIYICVDIWEVESPSDLKDLSGTWAGSGRKRGWYNCRRSHRPVCRSEGVAFSHGGSHSRQTAKASQTRPWAVAFWSPRSHLQPENTARPSCGAPRALRRPQTIMRQSWELENSDSDSYTVVWQVQEDVIL